MALAGGVTIEQPHHQGYLFVEGEILSPDGHCRPFDHRSQGTIFGSGLGAVVLRRLADAVEAAGGRALLTRSDHASGSDRVHEAVSKIDPEGTYKFVVNLQGDLPTLQPGLLAACVAPLRQGEADIATLAAEIQDEAERDDPHVVKVIATPASGSGALRALYFTRATAPAGEGPLYHHIGLYAFRREALQRFVSLPPSPLERREKLEQLRALEDGMRIDVALVDTVPLGVDTPADLERARALMAQQG